MMVKDVYYGETLREGFAHHEEILGMPNPLEVQKNSHQWFLDTGLREVFKDVTSITGYAGSPELSPIDHSMDEPPKCSVEEYKARDATCAVPIKVRVRLCSKEIEEIKEQETFMGDFPLMTKTGTLVTNGAECVIVSQIVRPPGIYYSHTEDKAGGITYAITVIPYQDAWLEYETNLNDAFYVRINKDRKLPITRLIRAVGPETDPEILELFGEDPRIAATLEKDVCKIYEDALLEIYRKLRPGEPPTADSAESLLNAPFFDPRRYDLFAVDRYKFSKKLSIWTRLVNQTLVTPMVDPMTGEIVVEPDEVLTRERAHELDDKGVNEVVLELDGVQIKVFSSHMADMSRLVDLDPEEYGVSEKVRFTVLQGLPQNYTGEELREAVKGHTGDLIPKYITVDDTMASINYFNRLAHGAGSADGIDHLGNRHLRCVGELLQNQFRIGFSRMERVIRERMTIQGLDIATPQSLTNICLVTAVIKELFGSSPLNQLIDQTNPLARLTHRRRVSALGPGGLSCDHVSFDVCDVHYSHYGRLRLTETPEGPNIGLISYLVSYACTSRYGFIEAPYRKVDKATGHVTDQVDYTTADVEDQYTIAQAAEPLDEDGCLVHDRITCRCRNEITDVDRGQADYTDISPKMMFSTAIAQIPLLENDDVSRVLMGANMQRQAVFLLTTQVPIVTTGQEHKDCIDSEVAILAEDDGVVTKVTADSVSVRYDDGCVEDYRLTRYLRSNHGTCTSQRLIADTDQRVEKGEVIMDGPSTNNDEIALGKSILMDFMTWEGYNHEDATLFDERMVKEDASTSIHIGGYETESRDTKPGPEGITRDIPNVDEDALKDLDERDIIRVGAEVRAGDTLVGRVTPKGETDLTTEERLLRVILGEKVCEVHDTSLKVPHGESGIIVDVKVFTREVGDELFSGMNMMVCVYIAQKRKIFVGDKTAGCHDNKGVVSRILSQEGMPLLPDGTLLDIALNPLGMSSRMNIGQVLEVHLGYATKTLGWKVITPVFDGADEKDIAKTLKTAGLHPDGKSWLYNDRTGGRFDTPVAVGYVYFLKPHRLMDNKIHVCSTGLYSLVTRRPLSGKAQFGGQRFGEMEVWTLEAYDMAYTLQEILTVKSDGVTDRVRTYKSIVKDHNVPKPGVPEPFKVLVKELQSLCLDIKVPDDQGVEIELKDDDEDNHRPGKFRDEDDDYCGYDAGGESDSAAAGYTLKEGNDDDGLAAANVEELDDNNDFSNDYFDEDMG